MWRVKIRFARTPGAVVYFWSVSTADMNWLVRLAVQDHCAVTVLEGGLE